MSWIWSTANENINISPASHPPHPIPPPYCIRIEVNRYTKPAFCVCTFRRRYPPEDEKKKILMDHRRVPVSQRSSIPGEFLQRDKFHAGDRRNFIPREANVQLQGTTAARFIAPVNFIIRIRMYGWTPINRGDLINLT